MDYHSLLDTIYEASLDPLLWPAVMTKLGQTFESNVGAVMFVANTVSGHTRVLGSADRQASVEDYLAHWARRDGQAGRPAARDTRTLGRAGRQVDIARATAALREGEICTDDMLIDRDALTGTAFYNDHLLKFDFHHALGAKVWDRPSGSGVLSLSRGARQGGFSAADVRRLASLQPHIQRSLAMAQRLAWTRVSGALGEPALAGAKCATLLLDESGIGVHTNAAADRLLAAGDGLRLVRGALQAEDGAVDARISAAITHAVRGDALHRRSGAAVAVPRRSGRPALAVLVGPVGLDDDWFLPQRPRALVTIVDPDSRDVPDTARLKALYRLTASEAGVAIGIGKGHELRAVADNLGLTIDSARQYLTRVYAKTATRRQNDLSSLLAALARD